MAHPALVGRLNHNTHYYARVLAAAPSPCRRALDVGCGDGLLVRVLASSCASVIGLDPSAEMIATARASCTDLAHVSFVQGTLADVDGPFDLIGCVAALHHMPMAQSLERMADLLAPGGTLVVIGLTAYWTPWEWFLAGIGRPAHAVLKWRHGFWEHNAPIAEPTLGWTETRTIALRTLPGARWRRHLLWRYSLTWTRPA